MNKETSQEEVSGSLNVHDIMDLLPHRYPFLMIDRVENIVLGESATGIISPSRLSCPVCSSSSPWPRPRQRW